jgi:glycine cleavage system H protein
MFRAHSLLRVAGRTQPRQFFASSRLFSTVYTKTHEWIKTEGDTVTIGITNYAQDALGEVVFVDQPDAGATFSEKETIVTLESVKAVGEVYAPADLEIVEANPVFADNPSMVNEGAEDKGWLVKAKLTGQLPKLLSREEYEKHLESL